MPRNKVTPESALLLDLLDRSYEKKSWHGPNLRGSIRGVKEAVATWRPGPGRHNIWENIVHAAYWKYIVRRRLLREKKGSFPLQGSNWFVRPGEMGLRGWREDIALLEETHRSLREAIAGMEAGELHRTPAGSQVSNLMMITGIAFHDIYHAGQIQLLKRLAKGVGIRTSSAVD